MIKPIKKNIATCYIYNECIDYIKDKYKDVNVDDFWNWLWQADKIDCNGCFLNLFSDDFSWSRGTKEQIKVHKYLMDEFGDEDGEVQFWVEW